MFESTVRRAITIGAALALTLSLGGVAAASPMDADSMGGGTMGGGGVHATMTDGLTPGGPLAPGSMMGDAADPAGAQMGFGEMGPGHMFTDVAAGDWFGQYAEQMAGHGFMNGFADGTFGGDRSITRGQFAGVMARMIGLEPSDGGSFSDTAGLWCAGAIEALAQNGIVAGYADGAFGPYDDITRAQMAAMMDRAWEWMEQNGMGSGTGLGPDTAEMDRLREQMQLRLHDVHGTWAEDHIAHMFGLGIVQGDQSGMFRPQATTTRAQASAMMWRWYEASQQ